ncbi:MAG TPA: hypothetical protein VJQ42_03010, partial [Rhodanobacteraceae bacterium]|nr:hypothetical protein [Rhodanobacteraceae bacterium]
MNAWLPRTLAQWLALLLGVAALVACLMLGLWREPKQALLSYLFAFFFFTGLSLGSLALLMIHAITGGAWGDCIRPPLLAAARLLPLMALASIPVLVCMRVLYDWTAPAALAHDMQARQQTWYLDLTFFVIRTVAYFVVWIAWLAAFTRNMDDRVRARRIAAPGLIVFGVSSLLASVDWVVSLTPHWHSSIFGMMVGTGWLLGACALAVAVAASPRDRDAAPEPGVLHDLGNLLLMFVMTWAYLAFTQYLITWAEDLPNEIAWYLPRVETSWHAVALLLVAIHF